MEVGVALGIADVVGWTSPPSVGDVCCLVIFPLFLWTPLSSKGRGRHCLVAVLALGSAQSRTQCIYGDDKAWMV